MRKNCGWEWLCFELNGYYVVVVVVVAVVVVLRIYVALAVLQPYREIEAGDNQSLKIQVVRPGLRKSTEKGGA